MYDNLSFVGAACLFCEAGEKTVIYSAEMFIFTDIIRSCEQERLWPMKPYLVQQEEL